MASLFSVPNLLLATDADWLFDDVAAALGGSFDVHRVRDGSDVTSAARTVDPELIILDLQIGNMGGVATSLLAKQEMGEGRMEDTPILLLLDREADVFLAEQSHADAWLVKPLNSLQLRRSATELVEN